MAVSAADVAVIKEKVERHDKQFEVMGRILENQNKLQERAIASSEKQADFQNRVMKWQDKAEKRISDNTSFRTQCKGALAIVTISLALAGGVYKMWPKSAKPAQSRNLSHVEQP